MTAVWVRIQAELRAHWRAWVAIGLAFGLAGGIATAAATGARRTSTVYSRFFAANLGSDVVTGGFTEEGDELARARRELLALPQIETYSQPQFVTDRFELEDGTPVVFPESFVFGDAEGNALQTIDRAKVIHGRMFRPEAGDEAVIDLIAAERLQLHPGDTVTVILPDPETYEPSARRRVTVVGVIIAPGGLPSVGQAALAAIHVSPAFVNENAAYLPPNTDGPTVRLRRGAEDIPAFEKAAAEISPNLDFAVEAPRHISGVQTMLRYDVSALWLLCGLLVLAAIGILGQAISRQLHLESANHEIHAALGTTRRQLIAGDLLRASMAGAIGAIIVIPTALLASILTPFGLARLVEPQPGVVVDPLVLAIGAAATFLGAVFLALIPAIRLARRRSARVVERSSRVARALSALGAGPSATTGARLAFDPGRGGRSIPIRSALAGLIIAVASLAAAGTFQTSFHSLIDRPALYGFTWDVFIASEGSALNDAAIKADPDVVASTVGGYAQITLGGRTLLPLIFEPGAIEPTILDGRAPQGDDEIALGTATLRRLKLKIGDSVMVRGDTDKDHSLRIVGRVVVPPIFFQQLEPGEGSAMTLRALARIEPESDREEFPRLIRYREGVDIRAKVASLRAQIPDLFVGQIRTPAPELLSLARSTVLPLVLTAVLLALALATLSHTLVASVNKRRRDLAILKTLGFVGRQIRAVVTWQVTALIFTALAIGLPAGIIAGRWGWRLFANSLGVVPLPVVPLISILAVTPAAALVTGYVIAQVPARRAVRMSPAAILRAEFRKASA